MQQPTVEMIYDTLAQIMQEGKIYQTSKGYFIVTPEYVQNPLLSFISQFINNFFLFLSLKSNKKHL